MGMLRGVPLDSEELDATRPGLDLTNTALAFQDQNEDKLTCSKL